MKLANTKLIILQCLLLSLLILGCEKNENEQPNVKFTGGSYIHKVNDNTFYKYIGGVLFEITSSDTTPITELTIPMFDDTIFPQVDNKLTVVLGNVVFFKFEGMADGIVFYAGDSTSKGISQRYEDYPLAIGTSIIMDPEINEGKIYYRYSNIGTYYAKMVARNFWEIEEDDKEQVKTIEVTVLDKTEYSYISK